MMNFLMSFIEENVTHQEGIVEISSNKNEIKYKREESFENSHMLTNKNIYSFSTEIKKYFMNLFLMIFSLWKILK